MKYVLPLCLSVCVFIGGRAQAASSSMAFTCLQSLYKVSNFPELRKYRKGFEAPHLNSTGHAIYFPKIEDRHVTGFYVYSKNSEHFFDAVLMDRLSDPSNAVKIADLPAKDEASGKTNVFELVTPLPSHEILKIGYMPGYHGHRVSAQPTAVIGASLFPVFGVVAAMKSDYRAGLYIDPLQTGWVTGAAGRLIEAQKYIKKIAWLQAKDLPAKDIERPLRSELQLRRKWLSHINLDSKRFRAWSQAMQTSCRGVYAGTSKESNK